MSLDGKKNGRMGVQMDMGVLQVGEATEEILTYLVDQVSFGVSVSGLTGQATLEIEGRIGDSWFALPDTLKQVSTGAGNVMLVFDKCRVMQGIRCRFANASEGKPVATVTALAVSLYL